MKCSSWVSEGVSGKLASIFTNFAQIFLPKFDRPQDFERGLNSQTPFKYASNGMQKYLPISTSFGLNSFPVLDWEKKIFH